ncbi:MAG: CpaF family protein [Actinomycetota bacterium]
MSLYERLSKANGTATATLEPRVSDPFSDLKRNIHQALVVALGNKLYDTTMTAEKLEQHVRDRLGDVLKGQEAPLSQIDRERLSREITDDILGHGPIEPYLQDPTVTEVMVNGPYTIYIEREGKLQRTPAQFLDESHLRHTIDKIVGRVGRRIDEAQPYVDARLPDGSRVNAAIPPIMLDGPVLTIRKFSKEPFVSTDLVTFGTITQKLATFLEACVKGRINVIISGGTGAGKTTTLNVVSSWIPASERIITIEDSAELRLLQPHVVRTESRPANIEGKGAVVIRDLVRNALRMRPDRIVVGECRGGEALDMLQAMNTGHDGSISTVHANTPRDVLSRLETMCLMAGMDLPVRAIREQIASAVQLIVHQQRLKDGTRRITHVTELVGMEGDIITLQDLFLFDFGMGMDSSGAFMGHIKPTGIRPKFVERLIDAGINVSSDVFAPEPFAKQGGYR